MGRTLENLEQFGIDVVLGRRRGFRAAILRGMLYGLSFIYERIVQLRLYLYRKRICRERTLGCLVISIGNLTVGGTGKTPVVEKFARALQVGGRRVAILSRGYKSVPKPTKRNWFNRLLTNDVDPPRVVSDGKSLMLDSVTAGDEPYMLAHNLKDVIVLVDKDRVKSGKFAIDKWKVDTLLLDDGLQNLYTGERLVLDRLHGACIGSICAIAAPESFEGALKNLGANVDLSLRYIDHHYYTESELRSFVNRCIRRDLAMIITTEKDAVRMPRLPEAEMKVPIYFMRVEIEILSGHESWEHCVARICKPQPMLSPERFFA